MTRLSLHPSTTRIGHRRWRALVAAHAASPVRSNGRTQTPRGAMPSARQAVDDLADVYAQRSSSPSGLSQALPDRADNRVEAVGDRSPKRSNLRTEVLVTVLLVLGAVTAHMGSSPEAHCPERLRRSGRRKWSESTGDQRCGDAHPCSCPISRIRDRGERSSLLDGIEGGQVHNYIRSHARRHPGCNRAVTVEHGYGRQYAANQQVITANQNLIVPGELISIANGIMTIKPPVDHSPHRHSGDHPTN